MEPFTTHTGLVLPLDRTNVNTDEITPARFLKTIRRSGFENALFANWRYTDPQTVLADGLVPFFIDWGQSPHPARTAAQGASLIALRAEHPDAQRVQRLLNELGLDLPVQTGATPALVAIIDSPRGRVELR